MIRRVSGQSMSPKLRDGKIVFAHTFTGNVKLRDIVIVSHDGIEKIKRIQDVRDDQVYIVGDNKAQSTDSRDFGWIDKTNITAKAFFY
ncbi:MAG TPA: S26 family signal peptidase [Candidatus Saccharimonadales bacterium]|nr:S26 family signal peptidase [Candidatus Saccharimonadales bacterium]